MKRMQHYRSSAITVGMTRIEMLIELYNRAIMHLEDADSALRAKDDVGYGGALWNAERFLYGIIAGLDPAKDASAVNISRLLHFVLLCVEKRDFVDAVRILSQIRVGFESIKMQAIELEANGTIPPLNVDASFVASV
jgi:flagellar secretion chaperone FliS